MESAPFLFYVADFEDSIIIPVLTYIKFYSNSWKRVVILAEFCRLLRSFTRGILRN